MTNTNDIVIRLRALANALEMGEWIALTETCANAADEIERLRNELDGAQLAYRGACYDRDRIKAERDEARREVCNNEAEHLPTMADPHMEAKRRGWDCFARDTSEHL